MMFPYKLPPREFILKMVMVLGTDDLLTPLIFFNEVRSPGVLCMGPI
jgi:hypothetical protein